MFNIYTHVTPVHYPSCVLGDCDFKAVERWLKNHLEMCLEKGYYVRLTRPLQDYEGEVFRVEIWSFNKANELTAYHAIDALDESKQCILDIKAIVESVHFPSYHYTECTRPLPI